MFSAQDADDGQILAARESDRQHFRRSKSDVFLPSDRGVPRGGRSGSDTHQKVGGEFTHRTRVLIFPGLRRPRARSRCRIPLGRARFRSAPGHHGYKRACDLISGKASTGPFGSPVFACAGKTESPSRLILSQTSAGKGYRATSSRALYLSVLISRWTIKQLGRLR
jgi:hypothetical protein